MTDQVTHALPHQEYASDLLYFLVQDPYGHAHCIRVVGYGFVDQCPCTDDGFLAYLDVVRCDDIAAHADVCTILDDDAVMPLRASMTGEIHAIGDGYIIPDLYLVVAQVI